jgi:hypothetical protein
MSKAAAAASTAASFLWKKGAFYMLTNAPKSFFTFDLLASS